MSGVLGELLGALWAKSIRRIEVLRSEVDAAGYDLLVACNRLTRWIQLKSSYNGSKTAGVTITISLRLSRHNRARYSFRAHR